MVIRKTLTSLAAASLIFGSAAAAAAPAAGESRSASEVLNAQDMVKRGTLGLLIAFLVATGILIIILSDDDEAVSP